MDNRPVTEETDQDKLMTALMEASGADHMIVFFFLPGDRQSCERRGVLSKPSKRAREVAKTIYRAAGWKFEDIK